MDKQKIGEYLEMASYVLGAISVMLLVTKAPMILGIAVFGAGLYFIGKYLKETN